MNLLKKLNNTVNWEKDGVYIIRKVSKWSDGSPRKVNVLQVYEKTIELANLPLEEDKSFLLMKSDFNTFGDWEMVEKLDLN